MAFRAPYLCIYLSISIYLSIPLSPLKDSFKGTPRGGRWEAYSPRRRPMAATWLRPGLRMVAPGRNNKACLRIEHKKRYNLDKVFRAATILK